MCSDEFFAFYISDNKRFCFELLDWALQETGVLRVDKVWHEKAGTPQGEETTLRENYFIEDIIDYKLSLSVKKQGKWVPFKASDLQMDFVMLDPYLRNDLVMSEPGVFGTVFRTPQRLGIFKFQVEYARHGLSYLHLDDEVSII